ncbi:hypothetical protein B5S33_g3318 [[Candida] boidinii]|nr:hypothetical protein B5S33_g3318 [[Candida] boidinii]
MGYNTFVGSSFDLYTELEQGTSNTNNNDSNNNNNNNKTFQNLEDTDSETSSDSEFNNRSTSYFDFSKLRQLFKSDLTLADNTDPNNINNQDSNLFKKMKFSHSLQFNSVPEWSSKYIAYSTLKKQIYTLQRNALQQQKSKGTVVDDAEHQFLSSEEVNHEASQAFISLLDKELKKIDKFYKLKETEIFGDFDDLIEQIEEFENKFVGDDSISEQESRKTLKDLIEAIRKSESASRRPIGTDVSVGNNSQISETNNNNVVVSTENNKPSNDIQQQEQPQQEHLDPVLSRDAFCNSYTNLGNDQLPDQKTTGKQPGADDSADENRITSFNGSSVGQNPQNLNRKKSLPDSFLTSADDNGSALIQVNSYGNDDEPHISRRKSLKFSAALFDDDDFKLDFSAHMAISMKRTLTDMFVTLSELKSYIELNKIGFGKALKKFDKALGTNIRNQYLDSLPENSYIFKQEVMDNVNKKIEQIIQLYALPNNTSFDISKEELRSHLREYIVWERNTVWRDMIGMERKTQAAHASSSRNVLNTNNSIDSKEKLVKIPLGAGKSLHIPPIFLTANFFKGSFITILTIILLNVAVFEDKQQNNCFALLVCASLLWATETIPLYVTSLIVPLMIVLFRVLKEEDGSPMKAADASKYIFATMWSSIIMLLLGGFTLAAALSKYHIDRLACTYILSKAGTNPKVVLLVIMSVAAFASMWVSNVAAPVLMYSVIQSVLRTLPEGSEFAKALIIGIALASNIAGMSSPIASPQNLVGIQFMDPPPTWGEWFTVSIPVCVACLILVWIFLVLTFDFKNTVIAPIRSMNDKFSLVQGYISFVCFATIVLWCLASKLEDIFGEMGMIAILPMLFLYGPGLLTTEDINNYPWNIVLLAMGGLALGKAVTSSQLLATIALVIQKQVDGYELWSILLIFGILILTMATFVSHTVAALIIVPLVAEIGNSLPDPHPRILVLASAFLCSCAMGLPTSGFPNVTAICMLDNVGKPYLTVGTFITRGVPASIICYGVVVTVGYIIMKIINF